MKKDFLVKAGIYCRLSRDDDNFSESESITNQKRMLAKYAKDNGFDIYDYYVDDGISGTTFNRPDFQRMLTDIESKKINLVITKDLSRLGRDYIQTGYYMEVFFPQKNVRYIAVNDGVDTLGCDNDIAPFKNILNEMYAKDISKKVRAAFRTKVEHGEFIGSFAPYGYKKSPVNKNKLIIDEGAAKVVKRIFHMSVEGYGLNKIARVLNDESIPNPTMYARSSGSNYINNMRIEKTYYWTNTTIRKILKNEVYIGNLVQGKQRTKSFKCRQRISLDENDWITVENSHDAIIDFETWNKVQGMLSVRKRVTQTGETHLFSGLIKCADCGRFMSLGKHHRGFEYFVCGTYKNYGPDYCTRHGIHYENLYNLVLQDIRYHAELSEVDEQSIIEMLSSKYHLEKDGVISGLKSELAAAEARNREIDGIYKQMYEDRIKGILPENRFMEMCRQYNSEQERTSGKVKELKEKLEIAENSVKGINYWAKLLKKYTNISELNKSILNELIDKIIIGDRKANEEGISQDIKIVYKFLEQAS